MVFAVLLLSCLLGQGVASLESRNIQEPRFGSSTTAVVVDVVVRDNRGNPITDLRKEEFRLFEDGVPQEIGELTQITVSERRRNEPANRLSESNVAGLERAPVTSMTGASSAPSVVAIVIDRLSPTARAGVYKSLLAWIDRVQDNDLVGVYLSDLSLTTIQPYTNDRESLRRAVKKAATRATSVFDQDATAPLGKSTSTGDARSSVPVVASAESVGRPVDVRGDPSGGLEIGTRNSWEAIARDQQGYATTNALLAVADALGRLPGRKSVVFFAESLAIPDAVLPHFLNVVATANRSNVSVYTIDAAGLRVHSTDAETGRDVRAIGAAGLAVSADGSNQSSLGALEQNEDVLRKSPRVGLTRLAEATGGVFSDNTNDLTNALRRVDVDRHSYYLLTYTPKRSESDGKWRVLSVTSSRPRVRISARSGYLALRTMPLEPLLAYEGPALAALDQSPRPAGFPVTSAAFVFPDRSGSQVALLLSSPAGSFTFKSDAKAYRSDFTALARIVAADGHVVHKASQRYQLTGPLDQLARVRESDIVFVRSPVVPVGTFTLEVVFHDALADAASVHRVPFTVPDRTGRALLLSDIAIIGRAERLASQRANIGNPLVYEENTLLVPVVGDPISLAPATPLTFYFVAVAPDTRVPEAVVELTHRGEVRARVALPLRGGDASGRIAYVGRLALDKLSPGPWGLKIVVSLDDERVTRETTFVLSSALR